MKLFAYRFQLLCTLFYFCSKLPKCIQMKIHRPFSNHTTSRISHGYPAHSSQQYSEQYNRRSHFFCIKSRYFCFLYLRTVQIQIMFLPPGIYAECTKDFFHAKYICDPGTVSEYADSGIKKCSRHHGKCSIFGTLYPYRTMKRSSSCYAKFIQSFHSQRASYLYYMFREIFCDSLLFLCISFSNLL